MSIAEYRRGFDDASRRASDANVRAFLREFWRIHDGYIRLPGDGIITHKPREKWRELIELAVARHRAGVPVWSSEEKRLTIFDEQPNFGAAAP